jgi:hypothetical protein
VLATLTFQHFHRQVAQRDVDALADTTFASDTTEMVRMALAE